MIVVAISLRNSPPLPLSLTLAGGVMFIVVGAYAARKEWQLKKLRWFFFIWALLIFVLGATFLLDGIGQLLHR